MSDKFRTKKGRLTHYALACGYIELAENPRNSYHYAKLELGGPGQFDVKHIGHGRNLINWFCFDTLTKARRHFDRTCLGEGLKPVKKFQ